MEQFNKGDYIVLTDVQYDRNITENSCGKTNYCIKQRETDVYIRPEIDLNGNKRNGHMVLCIDKKEALKDWRYATADEKHYYGVMNKPFDVSKLPTIDYIKLDWPELSTEEKTKFIKKIIENLTTVPHVYGQIKTLLHTNP